MADLESIMQKISLEENKPGSKYGYAYHTLYANESTGTVVLEGYVSNLMFPDAQKFPPTEYCSWKHYVVGNEHGYAKTGSWVHSEASIALGKITEDETTVTIGQHGYQTVHFGIKIPVGNLVFEKKKFTPYTTGAGYSPIGEKNGG